MNHPIRTTSLVVTAVALLTGCSWSQIFRLSLTVVDKADGKSLPGAEVMVDASSFSEDRKNDRVATGFLTDEAGRLEYDFQIGGYTPEHSGGTSWYLKVSKEGYEPVVIDIKPKPPPERNKEGPIPMTMKIEMQRAKVPPR
jgi:hypothetical protein